MRVIRSSTVAFWREGRRTPGYSLFDFVHGQVYARWPYLYIGLGTGEHRLTPLMRSVARIVSWFLPQRTEDNPRRVTFADTYHGKALVPASARRLVSIREEIHRSQPEQIIPMKLAREIVLHDPQHIVALDCPCRVARSTPCLPLDVCLIVGEPFASFVHEHHPRRSRPISQAEAVAILDAEHARGHVAHAFFKDAMLGRFYAICNCCACCCGAMQAQRNGVPMLISSGYVSAPAGDRCTGCGACAQICPFGAITLADGRPGIDSASCLGCGVCVSHCPRDALMLRLDAGKPAPLEI
jgi:ferredoxin